MADKPTNQTTINVSLRNTETVLYEGPAKSISSLNEKGTFDVLPLHANFISILKNNVVVHLENGENKKFDIDTAVLRVYENAVDIFLGIEPVDV